MCRGHEPRRRPEENQKRLLHLDQNLGNVQGNLVKQFFFKDNKWVYFLHRRRENSTSSDDIESQIDQKTEANLKETAARINLSEVETKHILKVSSSKKDVSKLYDGIL